ncbi:hypothetical protein [Deinococcus pimensis]|uniref:hypothetical protein n=1 Tax=Deinococcus pimensis TaxID=309888 RepID=UPI000480D305|nr:hypothetical protein [Deinococcus pimensis]
MPLLLLGAALSLGACARLAPPASAQGPLVTLTVTAPLRARPGGPSALGLPVDERGASPVTYVKVRVYRAEDVLLERPLVFDPEGTVTDAGGTPYVELGTQRPTTRLRLPEGRYRFESVGRTAPDGGFLAYGVRGDPEGEGVPVDLAHPSVSLVLHALADPRQVGLEVTALQQVKAGAARGASGPLGALDDPGDAGVIRIDSSTYGETPLRAGMQADLSLSLVTPEVGGRRYRVPASDYAEPSYTAGGTLGLVVDARTKEEVVSALGARVSVTTVADAPETPYVLQSPRLTVTTRAWVRTGEERAEFREVVRTFYGRYSDETFTGRSPGRLGVTSPVVFRQEPFVSGEAVPSADEGIGANRGVTVSLGTGDAALPVSLGEPDALTGEVPWRYDGADLLSGASGDRVVVRAALTNFYGAVFEPVELPVVDLTRLEVAPGVQATVTAGASRWWRVPAGACGSSGGCVLSWGAGPATVEVFSPDFERAAPGSGPDGTSAVVGPGGAFVRVEAVAGAAVTFTLDGGGTP